VEQDKRMYPTTNDIKDVETCMSFLPDSLKLFMNTIIRSKSSCLNSAFLGQSLLQAMRPRSLLLPMEFSLGIQLHHHLMRRFVIDTLNALGIVPSYMEVLRYEENASVTQGTDMQLANNSMLNYIADNADHNKSTLDGHDNVHVMGIMVAATPGFTTVQHVPRKKVNPNDIKRVARTQFFHYNDTKFAAFTMKYMKLDLIKCLPVKQSNHFQLFWKTSLLFKCIQPQSSGMIQLLHKGVFPGKSSMMFLPLLNMEPTNNTCIYSTLRYAVDHASRHEVDPVVTFDQPLWWKAKLILNTNPAKSEMSNLVLRLGGFHTIMSYLGSIGYLMDGSGIEEIL